jgi:predicted DNA-binding transcriptional regulator YafY
MTKQSKRHPQILRSIVLGEGKCDIESLALAAGVSEKTIRRDLQSLRQLGFPIEDRTSDHGRKSYFLPADAVTFKLTYDEVFAVLLACEGRGHLNGTTWGQATELAIEKIRASCGPIEKRYVDRMADRVHRTQASGDYRNHRDIVDALTIGVEDSRATFITYHSASSTEPVTYDIHPYAIAEHRGTLYVVGYSCYHNELRTWKVDRMLDAEATLVPFQRPKDFDASKHFAEAFAVVVGTEPVTVRVRFTGTAARYAQEKQMHPSQQVVSASQGVAEITYQLSTTFEIKSWILSFGSSAEVIEPITLRKEILQELNAAVACYSEPQAIPGGRA